MKISDELENIPIIKIKSIVKTTTKKQINQNHILKLKKEKLCKEMKVNFTKLENEIIKNCKNNRDVFCNCPAREIAEMHYKKAHEGMGERIMPKRGMRYTPIRTIPLPPILKYENLMQSKGCR